MTLINHLNEFLSEVLIQSKKKKKKVVKYLLPDHATLINLYVDACLMN